MESRPVEVLRRLAEGGEGDLYLVRMVDGRAAVLKTGRTPAIATASPLAREFEILSRLRHPSLVSVIGFAAKSGEILGEERGPCYWMEYVQGKAVLEAAKGADPKTIFSWMHEALEGLAYLHAEGLVHGDLSPSNLLIDSEGRLKIVDFGSAVSWRETSAFPGTAASLPYAAPERIGGTMTPAADLFSLGTIFYEALAGTHPRTGKKRLSDLLASSPQPLLEAAPSLKESHPFEARVIDGLIRPNPGERLGDAREVLEALRSGRMAPKRPTSSYYCARMIGAERHFGRIARTLESPEKTGAVFAVHGGTGVGKTRFLREILFHCALKGIDAKDVRLLPDLGDLSAEELARISSAFPGPERLTLLEWNDDRISGEKKDFVEGVVRRAGGEEIRLSNLTERQTEEFLAQAIGGKEAREIALPLFRQTGGNPLLLSEIAGLLLGQMAEGHLPSLKSLYREGKDLGKLEEILELKLKGVETADRSLLLALATADAPEDDASLGEVSNVVSPAPRLLGLLGRHLVARLSDGRFTLPLPPLREILLRQAGPDEIRESHRAWLKRPDSEGDAVATVRHALALGERALIKTKARPAAEDLEGQGRREEALEVIHASLPLVESADERSRLLRIRINLLNELGRFEAALEACEEWKGVAASDEPPPLREAKYWFITGMNHSNLRNDEEAALRLTHFLEAANPKEEAYRPYVVRAASLLGLHEMRRGRLDEAEAHLRRGLDQAGPDNPRRAELFRNLAELETRRKNLPEAARLFREARSVYARSNDFSGLFSTALQEGNGLLGGGGIDGAERLYREAEETARTHGLDLQLGLVWSNQSYLSLIKKKPFEALRLADRALELLVLAGNKPQVEIAKKLRTDALNVLSSERASSLSPPASAGPSLLPRLRSLHRDLLRETETDKVLDRLMDGALELSRAERGFLVLESGESAEPGGILPGYRVAVFRRLSKKTIEQEEIASLSAVRRALASERTIVADNAMIDDLFRDAKSVHLQNLRSILAVPVRGVDHVLGVFYLDHRLEEGLFGPETVATLETFSDMAALALQKGQMIDDLRTDNRTLVHEIEVKTSELGMLEREVQTSRRKLTKEYGGIIGRSPKMIQALELVDRVTDAMIPVWIYGESGTGKEAIARALHFNSGRRERPFVTENCSALPETLLESELFGHKKGAFTGATADKKGILQHADGGTVFLDEIADMSRGAQAKLLRFLQEGEIRPVGSGEVIQVDVRVVSASNRDLTLLVKEGKFRKDLYFRLNGVTVRLPPLRERPEDIPPLTEHFLKGIAEREGKDPCRLVPETMRIFLKYDWPGNIRELLNTLETAVLFAEDGVVTPASLAFKSAVVSGGGPGGDRRTSVPAPDLPPELMEILKALRDEGFHRGHAAKALGISLRTLYARLERSGVPRNHETLKEYVRKYV